MVIAIGSYPIGRRFESHRRYHVAIRLCRAARFQGGAVHSLCAALPPQAGTAHPAENSFFSKSVRRLFEGKEISGPAPQISAENDRFCGLHTYGPMVKRLRHRPFTAVTRVRVPVGSPTKNTGNRLCFLLVAPSGAANPKGSREQALPATPRRGGPACGVSADTRWSHRALKKARMSVRASEAKLRRGDPVCGVSATGGAKVMKYQAIACVFCWSRRQARRTCLAIAARIPKRTSVL